MSVYSILLCLYLNQLYGSYGLLRRTHLLVAFQEGRNCSLRKKPEKSSVDVVFYERWRDKRLEFLKTDPEIVIPYFDSISYLWTPESFFANEVSSKDLTESSKRKNLVRITSDGTVRKKKRLALSIPIETSSVIFPFEAVNVSLLVQSWTYDEFEVTYEWDVEPKDGMQIGRGIEIPEYFLSKSTLAKQSVLIRDNRFSQLAARLILHRVMKPYMFWIYLPTFLSAAIAATSFWVPRRNRALKLLFNVGAFAFFIVEVLIAHFAFIPKLRVDSMTGLTYWISGLFCYHITGIFSSTLGLLMDVHFVDCTGCLYGVFKFLYPTALLIFLLCYIISFGA